MSDTRSQLEEIDALIAAAPNDPALQQLREDLLQLIALEEQEQEGQTANEQQPVAEDAAAADSYPLGVAEADYTQQSKQHAESAAALATSESTGQQISSEYAAKGTFMEHNIAASKEDVAEAPDIGSFQPVYSNATKSQSSSMNGHDAKHDNAEGSGNLKDDTTTNTATATTTQQPPEKKKKKKKKKDDAVLDAKSFELPSHLVPLESDTPAQKMKKQRTAKALKSKFREKQKEAQHAKKQNDWKSFATKTGKRKKGIPGGSSIFSTEEGVDARVGVVSGGGRRTMTGFQDPNKRHKFT